MNHNRKKLINFLLDVNVTQVHFMRDKGVSVGSKLTFKKPNSTFNKKEIASLF